MCPTVLFLLYYLESVLTTHTKEGQGNVDFIHPFACNVSLCRTVLVITSVLHYSFWQSNNKDGQYASGLQL